MSAAMSARRRVMLIDESVDTVASLTSLLRIVGCDVLGLHSDVGALNCALAFDPDVALLDLSFGTAMGGIDIARQFRTHPRLGRTSLVAVTGWSADCFSAAAYRAGFHAFYLKPADPDQLIELVRAYDFERRTTGFPAPEKPRGLRPPGRDWVRI